MSFTTLILAAGRSKRMGTPKAWLHYQGRSLLQHIVDTSLDAGSTRLVVVAGAVDDSHLVSRIDIATRINIPRPEVRLSVAVGCPDGQPIDSIRTGLELIVENTAVLLWPVDCPFASPTLVRALVTALDDEKNRIAVPQVGSVRCHPVLLGAQPAIELTSTLADTGAREIVRRHPGRVVAVPCDDIRLTRPLNTPEEAQLLGVGH